MRQVIKAVDDLKRLVDDLMERVEALEEAREQEDAEGRGLRLFDRWRRRDAESKERRNG